jgi:hypothetical protein
MASSNYSCSIKQGFNFEKDQQVLVGHLMSMTIGGTALPADTTVTSPTDLKNETKLLGVISDISWAGGYADPIYLNCNVSNSNQKLLQIMKHTNLLKTDVLFVFNIYVFDQVAKKYYLAFHNDSKDGKGLIMKSGGDLLIDIAERNDPTVPSPLNYNFSIGIMPQETAQVLNFAVSDTDKFVKTWGVTSTGK